MLARWPIRNKLFRGAALLLVLVLALAGSTFYGGYAYRDLVKSLGRLNELRLVNDLVQRVSELRLTASQLNRAREVRWPLSDSAPLDDLVLHGTLRQQLDDVRSLLAGYRDQLVHNAENNLRLGGGRRELETLGDMEDVLERLERSTRLLDVWGDKVGHVRNGSKRLQDLAGRLPGLVGRNILKFTNNVRGVYRTFLFLAYFSLALTLVVLAILVRLVYRSVFQPLRILVQGSRSVASGCFNYRIHLDGNDEIGELATAMNDMTTRFLAVRDQLDRQVQERTRQIVQTEQQAGIGFLAAGVSHEINNPLASIALSAESLERRLSRTPLSEIEADMRSYLRRISSEAARCRGITGKLMDFSRMGDARREPTRLSRLVQDVVEILRHVGKFHDKRVAFHAEADVIAQVHPEEIKQVVLNLVTNALESIEKDGLVEIRLRRVAGQAEITVSDNGCGMTDEVRQHLFEPFFTRRQNGQGTGLGLSIADRIISDHGGQIVAASEGPRRGSEFRVRLPLEAEKPATAALLTRAA